MLEIQLYRARNKTYTVRNFKQMIFLLVKGSFADKGLKNIHVYFTYEVNRAQMSSMFCEIRLVAPRPKQG